MKKLDKKDKTYLNYSTQDGKNLKNIFTDKITLKQKSICYNCKAENNKKSYCKYCGKSLDEVEHLEKVQNIKAFNVDTKPIILTSVTSALILFLISLGIKLLMNFNFGELIDIVNPLHIMLGMNLATINLNTSTIMNSGSITIHLG